MTVSAHVRQSARAATAGTAAEAPSGARSPLRLALDSPSGRFGLWASSAVAALQAAGLVLVADAIARGIVRAMEGGALREPIVIGIVGVLCQAIAAWAGKAAGAMSSAGAKTGLRRRFISRVFGGTGRDVQGTDGALALLATRSLDEVDDYFTAVVPALTASAVVPLVVGARILWADWVSALIVVLTLPLVPLFMILIGQYTAERVEDATKSLDRLSGHLVELARGVPVLVGLGRLPAQAAALRDVSTTYRDTTMTTLRVAFLSALALELIATLSVAVVAVFVGVRWSTGTWDSKRGCSHWSSRPNATCRCAGWEPPSTRRRTVWPPTTACGASSIDPLRRRSLPLRRAASRSPTSRSATRDGRSRCSIV